MAEENNNVRNNQSESEQEEREDLQDTENEEQDGDGEGSQNASGMGNEQGGQSAGQKMEDTANAVREGANVAKKFMTGNKLGAIKDGIKLMMKNKKARRHMIINTISQILGPFLMILIAGALLLGVFNAVGDAVEKVVNAIVEFFTIDPGDGAIVISDEQIDTIINSISDLGVSMDGLKLMGDVDYNDPNIQEQNRKALRKYIREFYEAQAMTQTLNTNPSWVEEHILNGGKPFGTVYVYRPSQVGGDGLLTFEPYESMKSRAEANDTRILKLFSIDEEGKLVIAGSQTTSVTGSGSSTKIVLKHIDYRNVISQYTTSMNFFLYLTMITQNPEFVSAVTDLVKQSDIRLTVYDTESNITNVETYTYTENTKTRKKVETNVITNSTTNSITAEEYTENTTEDTKTITTTTTTKSITPVVKVTYAKTWFCEQTITYNEVTEPNSSTSTETEEDEEEPELTGEGTVTWKTNQTRTNNVTSNVKKYEEATRGDVIDKTGEKGSQGIKDLNGNGKVDGSEIVDENSTFLGLLDNKFKIPNSTRYESAGGNLVSGAEMFFYLLQKDSASQNLEQIMRYVLYKYSGKDYGITEFNFNIFDARDFTTISGGGNKLLIEYIHMWENAGGAPKNADGTKYIIHDDGYGHPTVGYGVDIFNGGYASLFEQAGYPTHIGGEVDIEFVDALEKQEIQSNIDTIKAITAGLDLKEYQIHALVSRAYNCGTSGAISVKRGSPAMNFVDSYNKYYNPEVDDQFEEQNNSANFSHSLYTQYMSKPVTSAGEYSYGLERRRKSEWTLFQTGYYDVLDKWYKEGGDILEMCEIVMNDLLDNNVHYTLSNLVWNDIERSNDFSTYGCCCATYVSVVLYRSGALTADHINKYNYNLAGDESAGGVGTMLYEAGWIRVSEEEAQPGDVCTWSEHVMIYAGDNEIWDQTCGCISSDGEPPVRGTASLWNYYKNTYNIDVWRMP